MRYPLAIALLSLTGCASMPDATIQYWLPKAESKIKVIETYACTADKKDYVVVATPSITTTYTADKEPKRLQQIPFKDLKGYFSSPNATFSFTEDGRLKSVNATSVGTGGEVVKEIVGVVTGVRIGQQSLHTEVICDVIEAVGDPKTKTITLTRTSTFDHNTGEVKPFAADSATKSLLGLVANLLDKKEISEIDLFTELDFKRNAANQHEPIKGALLQRRVLSENVENPILVLNDVRRDVLVVTSARVKGAKFDELARFEPIVPDVSTYGIQLPKPAFFGENTATLHLSEAGEITSVTYGAKSGAAAGIGAASQINSAVNPSVIQLALEEKAKADLVLQQQRVTACLGNRANCKP